MIYGVLLSRVRKVSSSFARCRFSSESSDHVWGQRGSFSVSVRTDLEEATEYSSLCSFGRSGEWFGERTYFKPNSISRSDSQFSADAPNDPFLDSKNLSVSRSFFGPTPG